MQDLEVRVNRKGHLMIIGDSPQLIVDLEHQENYIVAEGKRIPYKRNVELSEDLLQGKRQNVFNTAVRYYYSHACQVAEGVRAAAAYRAGANTTEREVK